jgi:hypothetical protein
MSDILHARLINWGRWRWRDLMVGAPDNTCQNPLYELVGIGDEEGYAEEGETGLAVVVRLHTLPAKAEAPEIDEIDAENLNGWMRQLAQGHRAALSRRYVMWDASLPWQDARAAVRALRAAMDANYETVREIERRLKHG